MNNRLQKKCFFAATGFHVSMLVVLLFGSAFFSRNDPPRDLQPVEMISPNVVEGNIVSGGSPDVKPPPATTPTQPVTKPVEPTPPTPPPTPKEKVVKPQDEEREKPDPKLTPPQKDSFTTQKNKPYLPPTSLTPKTRSTGKQTPKQNNPTTADSDATARDLAKAIGAAANSLKGSLSPGTKVGLVGPGGPEFTGYENIIQSRYQGQFNTELPGAGEIGESAADVDVSVTIGRDGTVRASRVTSPSRNAALNKLVQRVLDKVTFIAPFPKSSSDSERTFTITFDLKPKKTL